MTSVVDLQRTMDSLRLQAESLAELRRRCAHLRDARECSHARLDAIAAEIDAGIDECLRIAELAGTVDPGGAWRIAIAQLERQLKLLGALRAQVLALYVAPVRARCGA